MNRNLVTSIGILLAAGVIASAGYTDKATAQPKGAIQVKEGTVTPASKFKAELYCDGSRVDKNWTWHQMSTSERAASGSHQINFVHDATARFPGTVFVPYDKVTTCQVRVDTGRIMRPKCVFIDGWIGENVDVRQAASCVPTPSPDGLRSVIYKISPLMFGGRPSQGNVSFSFQIEWEP